ncbi:mannitol dehydrogenase family protein [Flavilitoribacter nigricans]|uniref:Mannitol dehydrogenase n=1 Tax=Flavilitoribacter nigricans (strain ATCC 23147 / DSM 23189 / NBRC 102662 / NCIMB 1420 / SS-2) TaxID=1122177 RepID=A0A2D0NBH4_FLAN2|nr:mannitol dehydrogenase family protein [Flavilitoribacter nigricans]PHN05738.1 mannitol dehydrogenase [Flavilitoribacter nigricans DSM 23189 = NBRC 102662]
MEIFQLNKDHLAQIKDRIAIPNYDRKKLKAGIVHIGVGGFHRSHQAYYIHQLLEKPGTADWGICGMGLREGDRRIYDVLRKQDYLYTLITRHPDGRIDSTLIGSIIDFILAVDTPKLAVSKMAHPDTRIVSLTITEGGYNFHPVTGAFDFDHPDIQHEIAHPDDPKTVYGFLAAALRQRRENGLPPFTILSCDNIQHNGAMARKMLLAFTERQDPELAGWIAQTVHFPNTMVDRITPVTADRDMAYLREEHGIADAWPVTCEPFIQWVVEDRFSNGRPPLEQLGVQFVPDVSPYEKMKIRLLNAGHSVLGIPGAIHGHPTINACMEDPVFATFMRNFMDLEATPVLDPVEGIDLEKYKDTLEERFANPNIKDSVARICSESSAKLPKFLLPTLQKNLAAGGPITYATLVLAAWCYYSDKQQDENGAALEISDVMSDELHRAARETATDPAAFLRQKNLFGDLMDDNRFMDQYGLMIRQLYGQKDIRALMQSVMDRE